MKMLKPIRSGQASNYPRKLNGSMLRVVDWMARIFPGETGIPVRKHHLQIPGRVSSHGKTCLLMALKEHRLSVTTLSNGFGLYDVCGNKCWNGHPIGMLTAVPMWLKNLAVEYQVKPSY